MSEVASIVRGIKKRLILHSAVGLGVVTALGGLAWFTMTLADDYAQQKQTLENEVNTLNNEMTSLRAKYSKVKGNATLYEEMMKKSAENKLVVDQQGVRDRFDTFRNDYYLSNLTLGVEGIADMKNYKGTGSAIVSSDINVTFSALTDVEAFRMLRALQTDFPGAIKVTSFNLRKDGNVTSDTLTGLAKSGATSFVTGDVRFTWFGIRVIDQSSKDPNAPKPN